MQIKIKVNRCDIINLLKTLIGIHLFLDDLKIILEFFIRKKLYDYQPINATYYIDHYGNTKKYGQNLHRKSIFKEKDALSNQYMFNFVQNLYYINHVLKLNI